MTDRFWPVPVHRADNVTVHSRCIAAVEQSHPDGQLQIGCRRSLALTDRLQSIRTRHQTVDYRCAMAAIRPNQDDHQIRKIVIRCAQRRTAQYQPQNTDTLAPMRRRARQRGKYQKTSTPLLMSPPASENPWAKHRPAA